MEKHAKLEALRAYLRSLLLDLLVLLPFLDEDSDLLLFPSISFLINRLAASSFFFCSSSSPDSDSFPLSEDSLSDSLSEDEEL